MNGKHKNGLKLESIGPNFSSCNANLLATLTPHYSPINPLSPKTDKHQFSPYIISMQSREEVMRIDKMITKGKMFRLFFIFSQLIQCRNVQRSVWRICMKILGLKGLNLFDIFFITLQEHFVYGKT